MRTPFRLVSGPKRSIIFAFGSTMYKVPSEASGSRAVSACAGASSNSSHVGSSAAIRRRVLAVISGECSMISPTSSRCRSWANRMLCISAAVSRQSSRHGWRETSNKCQRFSRSLSSRGWPLASACSNAPKRNHRLDQFAVRLFRCSAPVDPFRVQHDGHQNRCEKNRNERDQHKLVLHVLQSLSAARWRLIWRMVNTSQMAATTIAMVDQVSAYPICRSGPNVTTCHASPVR